MDSLASKIAAKYKSQTEVTLRVAARYAKYKSKKKVKDSDNVVYTYSEQQIAHRNREKAKRLEKLGKSIEKLRTQVKKDLKSADKETALTALAVSLIDETFERVGNPASAKGERNEDGEKHFGVTTWTKKHISFGNGSATIKYVGKSGVKHEKVVKDKATLSALKEAYDSCKGGLFDCGDIKVNAGKVNAYLKDFDVTAKDLRGFHANLTMRDQLKTLRKGKLPADEKDRKEQLKKEWQEALEATAELVGHEAETLQNQYLIPNLEDSYLKDGAILDFTKGAV